MSEIESISIKQCPICGKEFCVLYPDMYRYKRTDRNQLKYFCSWSCLREFDKQKGEKIMTVLSDDQRAEAVRIALTGKSPMPFLKECGIKNPSQCFKIIKKNLKESDPETWAKIPGTFKNYNYKPKPRKVKQIETPESEFVPAGKPKPLDGGEWEKLEIQEAKKPEAVETPERQIGGLCPPPEVEDDRFLFHTAAVRNKKLGTFYYDDKHGTIDWRHPYGEEISMFPEDYRLLRDSIDMILHVLGVEL